MKPDSIFNLQSTIFNLSRPSSPSPYAIPLSFLLSPPRVSPLPSPSLCCCYYGIQDILYPPHRMGFSTQNPLCPFVPLCLCSFALLAPACKFAQGSAKNSKIFKNFQTFRAIFRTFCTTFRIFSNVFEYFRTQLAYLLRNSFVAKANLGLSGCSSCQILVIKQLK
jgi:hypothetical protein